MEHHCQCASARAARETLRPDPRVSRLERQLAETFDSLWDSFVDPTDPWYDTDGTRWNSLGTDAAGGGPVGAPFANEGQLAEIRDYCRGLAVGNEFAINGHENRISYIVGTGHTYRVSSKPGRQVADGLVRDVQAVLDQFVQLNRWHKRQQEIVRRRDRDGEVFLRFFVDTDGITRVRFVEPSQIFPPKEHADDPAANFGIQTDPDDVETALGYYVDGRLIDAVEIQHRKANVDANVKRGLPLFYPVRKNLRRAEKLLRNMSVVAEIQSAIAIIRKHGSGTKSTVERFVQDQADAGNPGLSPAPGSGSGTAGPLKRYAPGTILDAFAGTDYQFPAAAIDASRFVVVLQAELRAIAARLVMPEFMLTADASNANYASTMVAEGPAVKMFQRMQHDMIVDDLEVMHRVILAAVEAGRLAPESSSEIDLEAIPPSLAARDRLREAQADQILVRNQAMSIQTLATRHGLDATKERQLIDKKG